MAFRHANRQKYASKPVVTPPSSVIPQMDSKVKTTLEELSVKFPKVKNCLETFWNLFEKK